MAPSGSKSRGWWALAASIALHLTLTQAAASTGREHAAVQARPVSRDSWTGTTFDVDTVLEAPSPTTRRVAQSAPAPAAEPKAAASAVAVAVTPRPADSEPPGETSVGHEPRKPARVTRASAPTGDVGSAATQDATQSAADAGAAFGTEGAAHTPSYGAAGEAPGERSLAKAFTRVLPRATNSDPLWDRLPIGYSARVYARLETNAEGHVVATDAWLDGDAAATPPELERLVKRAAGLLGTGQFALPSGVGAGAQTLRIDVLLKQGSASDDPVAEPEDTVELGFTAPSPDRPGRAFFRKASGRTLEMRVTLLGVR